MTTQRDRRIQLDREIIIAVTETRIETSGVSYRWDSETWHVSGTQWTVRVPDGDGATPSIDLFISLVGSELTISDDSGITVTTVLNRARLATDRFGQPVPDFYELRFNDNPGGFTGELTITLPPTTHEITETVNRSVYAERRDVSGETLEVSDSSITDQRTSFFTVRYEDGISLTTRQRITDDRGEERTITGHPAERGGRFRFLEFGAELVGSE